MSNAGVILINVPPTTRHVLTGPLTKADSHVRCSFCSFSHTVVPQLQGLLPLALSFALQGRGNIVGVPKLATPHSMALLLPRGLILTLKIECIWMGHLHRSRVRQLPI